jgi:hypothetical protein
MALLEDGIRRQGLPRTENWLHVMPTLVGRDPGQDSVCIGDGLGPRVCAHHRKLRWRTGLTRRCACRRVRRRSCLATACRTAASCAARVAPGCCCRWVGSGRPGALMPPDCPRRRRLARGAVAQRCLRQRRTILRGSGQSVVWVAQTSRRHGVRRVMSMDHPAQLLRRLPRTSALGLREQRRGAAGPSRYRR